MTRHAMKLSETLSAATTRRGFFKGVSRLAGAAALALGGLAAGTANAGKGGTKTCCVYQCIDWNHGVFYYKTKCSGRSECQERLPQGDCGIVDSYPVNDCGECGF